MKFNPVKITAVDLTFPDRVIGTLLPPQSDIPEEFAGEQSEWLSLVRRWFCVGLNFRPKVKPELDENLVWRHLNACMGSFEPSHEHKVAGVAYLMSLWCEPLPKDWKAASKVKP